MTGEVLTQSSTGGEKIVKPEAYSLIPWEAMDEVARAYDYGSRKYKPYNWRKGYEWGKSFSSLCRHIFAFWRGQDIDPESGVRHLALAVFHALTLITWSADRERYGQFDDRYIAPPTDPDDERDAAPRGRPGEPEGSQAGDGVRGAGASGVGPTRVAWPDPRRGL